MRVMSAETKAKLSRIMKARWAKKHAAPHAVTQLTANNPCAQIRERLEQIDMQIGLLEEERSQIRAELNAILQPDLNQRRRELPMTGNGLSAEQIARVDY